MAAANSVEKLGYIRDKFGQEDNWGGIGVGHDVIDILTNKKVVGDMTFGVFAQMEDGTRANYKVKPKDQPLPPVFERKPYFTDPAPEPPAPVGP